MSTSKTILFLAFALLAAVALPPSHAVRDAQAVKPTDQEVNIDLEQVQPSRWPFPGGIRPRQPAPVPPPTVVPAPPQEPPPIHTVPASPGSKPAMPLLPTAPASPDHKPRDPSPAPAQDCLAPLEGLVSCLDYLNNPSVRSPMEACCGALGSVVDEAPMCLCHAITGDISQIMPEPVNAARIVSSLPRACGIRLPLQKLAQCSDGTVPPLFASRS